MEKKDKYFGYTNIFVVDDIRDFENLRFRGYDLLDVIPRACESPVSRTTNLTEKENQNIQNGWNTTWVEKRRVDTEHICMDVKTHYVLGMTVESAIQEAIKEIGSLKDRLLEKESEINEIKKELAIERSAKGEAILTINSNKSTISRQSDKIDRLEEEIRRLKENLENCVVLSREVSTIENDKGREIILSDE